MNESLTVLDLIVMMFVSYMSFLGLKKGLLLILIELSGLLLSIYISVRFYLPFELLIRQYLSLSSSYLSMMSFLILWGFSFFVFYQFGKLIQNKISQTFFVGPINTIGGGILGAFRGLAMLIPFLLPFSYSNLSLYHESKVAKPLNSFAKRYVSNSKNTQRFFKEIDDKRQLREDLQNDPDLISIQKLLQSNS